MTNEPEARTWEDRFLDNIHGVIKEARFEGWQQGFQEGRQTAISEIAEGLGNADPIDHAREHIPESLSDPQVVQKRHPMRVMRVHFMNGTHLDYEAEQLHEHGWKVSRQTDSLVIGHGIPRIHIPLCNIKTWELLRDTDL